MRSGECRALLVNFPLFFLLPFASVTHFFAETDTCLKLTVHERHNHFNMGWEQLLMDGLAWENAPPLREALESVKPEGAGVYMKALRLALIVSAVYLTVEYARDSGKPGSTSLRNCDEILNDVRSVFTKPKAQEALRGAFETLRGHSASEAQALLEEAGAHVPVALLDELICNNARLAKVEKASISCI